MATFYIDIYFSKLSFARLYNCTIWNTDLLTMWIIEVWEICFQRGLRIRIRVFWSKPDPKLGSEIRSDPILEIWLDPNPVWISRFRITLKFYGRIRFCYRRTDTDPGKTHPDPQPCNLAIYFFYRRSSLFKIQIKRKKCWYLCNFFVGKKQTKNSTIKKPERSLVMWRLIVVQLYLLHFR